MAQTETNREFEKVNIERLIKVAPGLVAVVYVIGFLIVNIYLGTLGFVGFDLFSAQYISAGILFSLMIVASFGIALATHDQLKDVHDREVVNPDRFEDGVRIFFDMTDAAAGPFFFLCLPIAILVGDPYTFFYSFFALPYALLRLITYEAKVGGRSRLANLSAVAIFLYICLGGVLVVFLNQHVVTIVVMAFTSAMLAIFMHEFSINNESSRRVSPAFKLGGSAMIAVMLLFFIVPSLYVYSWLSYPSIPQFIGGGQPVRVNVSFNGTAPVSTRESCVQMLVLETANNLLLEIECESRRPRRFSVSKSVVNGFEVLGSINEPFRNTEK